MKSLLPYLSKYRSDFLNKGISYPLPTSVSLKQGLLKVLPKVKADQSGWPWTEETKPAMYDGQRIWPKITIVTPSYNQDKFIEETIRSVLLQNYPNLEYIIIDGDSTDSTIEVLKKYSPWISYWQSEKDSGQGHAINLGFSLASGYYYAWINSDDYYLKNVFKTVVSTFLNSNTEFVYGFGGNMLNKSQRVEEFRVRRLFDYFLRIPSLFQPSCFWKADIHQPIWEELECSLDYELWLRMIKGKRKIRIKKQLSVANVHDNAKTYDPKMKSAWERDHHLICSVDAHGPVYNWDKLIFMNSLYLKLVRIIEKVTFS